AFLPAEAGLAGFRREQDRGDRRARAARRAGSGAAEARAGELSSGRSRRGRHRGHGRRGAAGAGARLPRRRSDRSVAARLRATVSPSRAPRIYISAGEPSADAHAAAVAVALRRRIPGVELEALGGPLLDRAGAKVLDRMEAF